MLLGGALERGRRRLRISAPLPKMSRYRARAGMLAGSAASACSMAPRAPAECALGGGRLGDAQREGGSELALYATAELGLGQARGAGGVAGHFGQAIRN